MTGPPAGKPSCSGIRVELPIMVLPAEALGNESLRFIMDKAALDKIAEYIQERSSLCFLEHKRSILKKRLAERLLCLDLPSLEEYWRYLQSSAREESELLNRITINETSFFRNQGQFTFLANQIIPDIEAERGKEIIRSWGMSNAASTGPIMRLRILCAGCSTGQEPYSVAMAVFASLKYPRAWDIEILAGDLSESCISTASAGFYEKERLKGVPKQYVESFMEKGSEGATFKKEIKDLIKFCRLNLNDVIQGNLLPGQNSREDLYDIVFCRNVMIYFSWETQQKLVDTLYNLLAPGGYLFTGDVEPLHLYEHKFATVREAGCLIYRKLETSPDVQAI